jgi:hypothetical protein
MTDPFSEDSFPPLDISMVAKAIVKEWDIAFDRGLDDATREIEVGVPPICAIRRREQQKLYETVVEILRCYDEGRTRQIKFLRDELILMLLRHEPFLVFSKQPGAGAEVKDGTVTGQG